MKIIKYKKGSKGKYKVFLDDDRELILYEDVILKYNLLLSKELDEKTMIELDKYNQECDVYYTALNSINNRFKSVYELRQSFIKKEYPRDLVDKAIEKLLQQGYLNDRIFAKSYINNQIITTNKGPYKIMKELADKKIDSDIINEDCGYICSDTATYSAAITELLTDKNIYGQKTTAARNRAAEFDNLDKYAAIYI